MESRETIPGFTDGGKRVPRMSNKEKLLYIILLSVALMIGAGAIWLLAYDREYVSEQVSREISSEWGEKATIYGPILTDEQNSRNAVPKTVNIEANVNSLTLDRNIYHAEVYKADIKMSGSFTAQPMPDDTAKTLTFEVRIDKRNVIGNGTLTIGGKTIPLEVSPYGSGLQAKITPDLLADSETAYSAQFKMRGSAGLWFIPSAECNSLTINSNSQSIAFRGPQLAIDREVGENGFSAKWLNVSTDVEIYEEVPSVPLPYKSEQIDTVLVEHVDTVAIAETEAKTGQVEEPTYEIPMYAAGDGYGVEFVDGIDGYRKVVRAIKYAYLIILLTFAAVFATEVLTRHNIPLLSYFLIGAALVVFYSLLLSISEQLNFDCAYLISAVMTIGLICIYLRAVLQSRQLALYNGVFLTAIYGICYVMLCVSTLALLIGSLLIFSAIAAAMYLSVKLRKHNA